MHASPAGACAGCGRGLERRAAFQFQTAAGALVKCARCALRHPPMLRRSLAIAAIIGTVLLLINQGDVLLRPSWPRGLLWKAPLTYLVPFVVATWGALVNGRVRG